ncbi:NB-ARC domain-containing protein [Solwaraspora sp. WMMD1047]|uniref:NB-ARC domain-containing protein n=1 Tax=Solwaraspora sp. WMMD1047 TaxID=3016102 RepID=UPI00241605AC|nr:NB-ARC domain-containing protein [Solwaraspora sp. WMMD1047]MDG4834203.1 NB-ARC domain-containing protein [Solwaraspora sp. WMMD1047]
MRLVPVAQRPESWVVDRPVEVDQIVAAVRRSGGGTVGITTAVHGAGGFGKTTVAKLVRADRRVLRRFRGRVYWVTLGRDVRKGALVTKVNDLVRQVSPGSAEPFTDVRQAAEHLAAVLALGPRRLVVLDDVWFEDQLAAFPVAGRCARLVTTRVPSLVRGQGVPVKVDQMSEAQARAVLTAGVPPLPPQVLAGLLVETGRWPLLLRLVNKILLDQLRLRTTTTAAAEALLTRLRLGGAFQVDELTGAAGRELDVADPEQRKEAVAATIEASTGILTSAERDRFAELAIFAEDETVPVWLVHKLWRSTGALDPLATDVLCVRLADLALLMLVPTSDGGTVSLHDVVRDHLQAELGDSRLAGLHRTFLEAAAAGLPVVTPAVSVEGGARRVHGWWDLPDSARYLSDHLIEHLLAAGRTADAEAIATDLRWVGKRLEQAGPTAPYADLTLIDTTRAARLRRLVGQTAHLLESTEPAHSRIDILYSRVEHDPGWGAQTRELLRDRPRGILVNRAPLPDLADPALRRTLTSHGGPIKAITIAPDGAWLAVAAANTVRIFDAATGEHRSTLAGRIGRVNALAISPDGSWLATATTDRTVRTWDTSTGQQRALLANRTARSNVLAISPDGTWLATATRDLLLIVDARTGRRRLSIHGHAGWVCAVAISPDGTWFVTASDNGTVRTWDAATGRRRVTLAGHTGRVHAVAIAPDGTWLVTASDDRTVRVWDAGTGRRRITLTGYTDRVHAVAIAPDATWLATASEDGAVRMWDAATANQRATLLGHTARVNAVAISSDGTWLATASDDGSVRLWDVSNPTPQPEKLTGRMRRVNAAVVAPDGTWLVTASTDGEVRILDRRGTRPRTIATGHLDSARTVATAKDGNWVVTISGDGSARLWIAGVPQPVMPHGRINWHRALAIAPDGTWVAIANYDGTMRILDTVTAQRVTVLGDRASLPTAAASDPNGTWIAVAGTDGAVRIWYIATGERRTSLDRATGRVRRLVIAPDGTWLATASKDGSVRTWSTRTGRQRAQLANRQHHLKKLIIAPDGTWLATTNGDNTVQVWNADNGRQRAVLTGHTASINALAASPNSAHLATTGNDRTVRVWDTATGKAQAMMRVEQPVTACAWSKNGQDLAVGGDGGLYKLAFRY